MKWDERLGITLGQIGSISCPEVIIMLSLRGLQAKISLFFFPKIIPNLIKYNINYILLLFKS
jgi:hypothetical protein